MPIPRPEVGMEINDSFLWSREAARGQAEGLKDRPCAIVLTIQPAPIGDPIVTVAPITHSQPSDLSIAIEIPSRVKAHLGLDSDRSWIVMNEFNVFTWPGFDLRPIKGNTESWSFGLLPPKLFERVREKFRELRGRSALVQRDDS